MKKETRWLRQQITAALIYTPLLAPQVYAEPPTDTTTWCIPVAQATKAIADDRALGHCPVRLDLGATGQLDNNEAITTQASDLNEDQTLLIWLDASAAGHLAGSIGSFAADFSGG